MKEYNQKQKQEAEAKEELLCSSLIAGSANFTINIVNGINNHCHQ